MKFVQFIDDTLTKPHILLQPNNNNNGADLGPTGVTWICYIYIIFSYLYSLLFPPNTSKGSISVHF